MTSRGDVFASFDAAWPDVDSTGFEGSEKWWTLGRVPNAAGIEPHFWNAVHLQANGGARRKWTKNVDFYVHVAPGSDESFKTDKPFWLGLCPFAGTTRLWVSSVQVQRVRPSHRPQRHPGELIAERSTIMGLRLFLAENGTYFEVAR